MLKAKNLLQDREPISRKVYRSLRDAIISGDLEENSKIVEGDIADMLGVSRTPIREALSRLEVDGLVNLRPGAGYTVSPSEVQLRDIFHLRKATEGYCARLTAESATPELVARLEANLAAHSALRLEELELRAERNAQFHDAIVEACPSEKVRERARDLREFVFGPTEMEYHDDTRIVQTFLDDHRLLIEAMRARDGGMASSVMVEHLDRALRLLLVAAEKT